MNEVTTNTSSGSEQTTGANSETQQTTSNIAPMGAGTGKTFTQAELDRIACERLARKRAKAPSEDELKGYRNWNASQQTEAEKSSFATIS